MLLIFAMAMQTFAYDTALGKLGIVPMIVLIVGVIVNWTCYLGDKKSDKLKYHK